MAATAMSMVSMQSDKPQQAWKAGFEAREQ